MLYVLAVHSEYTAWRNRNMKNRVAIFAAILIMIYIRVLYILESNLQIVSCGTTYSMFRIFLEKRGCIPSIEMLLWGWTTNYS